MKFGSWTYGGLEVDLKHKDEYLQREEQELDHGKMETVWVVDEAIDLRLVTVHFLGLSYPVPFLATTTRRWSGTS